MGPSAPSGFAIRRNGTCASSEVDCGQTVAPFRACCPSGGSCPNQYNVDCCPSSANCTQELLQSPSCANSSWTLYDNSGYFCCAPGTIGYAASLTASDGCADPGYPPQGALLLSIVSQAHSAPSSSTSNTAPSATSSSFPSPGITLPSPSFSSSASPTPGGSSSNSGAIAGGVVGGVAAIAIALLVSIIYLRKRKSRARNTHDRLGDRSGRLHEKDATSRAPDANEADGVARSELNASKEPRPEVELQDTSNGAWIP